MRKVKEIILKTLIDERDQDFVFNFRIKGESCKLGIKRSGKDQKTTKELKNYC